MFFKASWKNGALGDCRQLVGSSLALVVFVESSFGDAAAVTPAAMEKFPQYSLYQKLWFLMLIFILSLVSLCLCVQFRSSCSSHRECLLNKGITSSVCLYIHIGVYMWSIHINTHWSMSAQFSHNFPPHLWLCRWEGFSRSYSLITNWVLLSSNNKDRQHVTTAHNWICFKMVQ